MYSEHGTSKTLWPRIESAGGHENDTFLQSLYDAVLRVMQACVAGTKPSTCAGTPPHSPSPRRSLRLKKDVALQKELERQEHPKVHGKLAQIFPDLILWVDAIYSGRAEATSLLAPEIYQNIVSLLFDCGKCLQSLYRQLGDAALDATSISALDEWLEKANFILDGAVSPVEDDPLILSTLADPDHKLDVPCEESYEDNLESLQRNAELLMDLLPSLETVSTRADITAPRHQNAAGAFQASDPAEPFIAQVAGKFSTAPKQLIDRLGEANWQRFCRLRLHQDESYAKELTQAKSVFHASSKLPDQSLSVFRDSALGSSLISLTKDNQSVASHSSFASSAAEDGQSHNHVPPEPPEVREGKSFICGVCNTEAHGIRTRSAWKHHVFGDLRPYVCLHDTCDANTTLFASRREWTNHELTQHRSSIIWRCLDCRTAFRSMRDFDTHLQDFHADADDATIKALQSAALGKSISDDWLCPLCDRVNFEGFSKFANHVCRHMRDIALNTLPQALYGEENESADSDEEVVPYDAKMSLHDLGNGQGDQEECVLSSAHITQEPAGRYGHQYGNISVDGYARAQIGDVIHHYYGNVQEKEKEEAAREHEPNPEADVPGGEPADNHRRNLFDAGPARLAAVASLGGLATAGLIRLHKHKRREEEDFDEVRYCYCNDISYGEMLACDNQKCAREWFHLECTGLKALPPASSTWFCDECKGPTVRKHEERSSYGLSPTSDPNRMPRCPPDLSQREDNAVHRQKLEPPQQASYRMNESYMVPADPAYQNPPCNTLYVGNLPMDASEDELKAMFSKQRGYKRLCFRIKQNGPMCFVEFEDISFATKALNELYGAQLHNSVKGGIRLTFSKYPLGVISGQPARNTGLPALLNNYSAYPEPSTLAQPQLRQNTPNPQLHTASYSNMPVLEMEVNGVAVMRRRADDWLNATHILKVAGMDKFERVKVLDREIHTGQHEKVQGGYGEYQGTWVDYQRGRELCRQYGVEQLLLPLLEYDIDADGGPANKTLKLDKGQAMAARR